jgi:signal transduction histidine kinase
MTTAQAIPAWSEAMRLAALDRYGILDTPTEAAFDAIVRLVADLLDAPIAAVNLVAGDRQWFKAELGLGVREMPLDDSICRHALLESSLMVVPDTRRDPRFACNPLVTGAPGLRFYAGALLRTPEGIPLGTLCVLDTRPRPDGISAQQRLALRTLGDQVMTLLELRRAVRERDAAQHALRHTAPPGAAPPAWRAHLETILEAGEVGTWTWDLRTGRVHADANTAAIFGFAAGGGEGDDEGAALDDYLRLIHPDDVEAVRASLERAVAAREPHQVVHRVLAGDGQERTVNARGRVETDATGAPVRMSGVIFDITREAAAEAQLRSSETARRAGEERYHTVLKSIDVGFCIIEMMFDAAGDGCNYRVVEVNDAFVRHTGLADAAGKTIRELIPTHDVRWSRICGRVAKSGLPVRIEQHSANLGRWLDVYAARLGDAGSHLVAVFLRDITEERARNETLRRLADDLAAANRRQSEFLATLAHELRNPLAPVRTGLDLLRLGAGRPEVLARVQPMMERQVNHLVHLVDDLLDLARINSGKVELRKAIVPLKDVVLRAIEMTLPAIEARHHDFHLDVGDEPLPVHADATRLAQVIGNLLTNAARYTPEGGSIGLGVRRAGGRVRIEVADSGIGIPAEALPRIFDMFSQVGRHPQQESGGLGIGLHLVRQMTELHGGTVQAHSPGPGRGTTFVVELPLATGQAA